MEGLSITLSILLGFVSTVLLLAAIPFFIRLRWPSPIIFGIKLFAGALSPLSLLFLIITALIAWKIESYLLLSISACGIFIYSLHILLVTRPPKRSQGFHSAFSNQAMGKIKTLKPMLKRRWSIRLPEVPEPKLHKDLHYATVPGTERSLLCDIWEPADEVKRSGLSFIYLHGSAWFLLDKDLGTRPFFKHLTAQGHLVMDIAYRLSPETNFMGMIHDGKRAVSWLRANADQYSLKPEKIVIGGGSAGGHLSLMVAYTANDNDFCPEELNGQNLSVAAVISEYGPTDLEACYYHTNQHLTTSNILTEPETTPGLQIPEWLIKKMGTDYYRLGMNKGFTKAGALAPMLGTHPYENAEPYKRFSPLHHVHTLCPPTLLVQGIDDSITKAESTVELYNKLKKFKVPVVLHVIPQIDHAFDLILPNISPSAHNAIFDVERFLAMVSQD